MQRFASIIITSLLLAGCASYYHKTIDFNQRFERNDYAGARTLLDNSPKLRKKANTRVIYDLNYATASFYMGDHATSREYFGYADDYFEAYANNIGYEALAAVSNPNVKPYAPEHFERVMLHMYQALNFVSMDNYEAALVECRRMNNELNLISDKFRKHNGRHYSRDAFGHYMMGILYETTHNFNDAFIAYRNAVEIYQNDYSTMYGVSIPDGLKTALIRSAYKTGFASEAREYEKEFGITYNRSSNTGRLVVIALDGLSPVKAEKSFGFTTFGDADVLTFSATDGSFSIPVSLRSCTRNERNSLKDFRHISVTLPEYVSRYYGQLPSAITISGKRYALSVAEDIEQIARQSLRDRFFYEIGTSLLRTALKQAMVSAANEKNEYLGLLANIINMVTDRADTRHWQTLPAFVRIVDIELTEGEHTFTYSGEMRSVSVFSGNTSFAIIRS